MKSSSVTEIIGYFGQLISALTEFHFIFSASGGSYHFAWSNLLPCLFGLLAVYIFEVVGVRVYLVRIVRQIANKEFNGSESWILFGFNLGFVIVLCGSNIWLSMLGQKGTFHAAINVTVTDKTHGLELEKTAKINDLTKRYEIYERGLKKVYNSDKNDLTARYDIDIKELKNSRWTYRNDTEKYNDYTATIDEKLISKTSDLKTLKSEFLNDKKDFKNSIDNEKNTILLGYDKRISDIEKVENSNVNLWSTIQKYTLPILILFILLSWCSIIYNEIFLKGAGQKIEVQETSKNPILITAFILGLYDWFYHLAYSFVRWIVGNKKVKYSDIKQHDIDFSTTKLGSKFTEPQTLKIAAQLDNQKRLIGFNRESDINNQNSTSNLPNNQLQGVSGVSKPFNNESLTFNVQGIENSSNVKLKDNQKHCKNCNNIFSYKHWNAQYCGVECRVENWEKRNGKTFRKPFKK